MALQHSPSIVTDGLVLCLDAANPKSYPGSGTTWRDLSGRENNGTLGSLVTFSSSNSGRLSFVGSQTNSKVDLVAGSDFNFGTANMAIECWVTWDGTYQGVAPGLGRSIYSTGASGSLDQIGIFTGAGVYFGGVANDVAANYPVANAWSHIVATRIGTTIRIYINGVETASGTQASAIGSSVMNPTVGIRRDTAHPWLGNISVFRIYKNKGLTESEVSQNFNALRGRFGI